MTALVSLVFTLLLLLTGCSDKRSSSPKNSPFGPVKESGHDGTILMGSETQNGGYGVKLSSGQVVSLDLYLRDAYQNPYLSLESDAVLSADEKTIIARNLAKLTTPDVIKIVEKKLAEMRVRTNELELVFGVDYVISNIANYTWVRLGEIRCLDVHDDNAPIANKVQLAYRDGRWVRFCGDFEKLDNASQAALILHEILYAALVKKSWVVELTGFLFSQDYAVFDSHPQNEMRDLINAIGPHVRDEGRKARVLELAEIQDQDSIWKVNETRLCAGRIRHFSQETRVDSLALWQVPQEQECGFAELKPEGAFTYLVLDGFKIKLGSLVVGGFESEPLTITSLCSRAEIGLCALSQEGDNVTLKQVLPSDDFFTALKAENTARLEALIKKGQNINALNSSNENGLCLALKDRLRKSFDWLLANKVDVNAKSYSCASPFFYAYTNNLAYEAMAIASHGFDFKARHEKHTALTYAVSRQDGAMVRFLVEKKAPLNEENESGEAAVVVALAQDDYALADFLVKKGANLDVQHSLINRAIRAGQLERVRWLLERGASADYQRPIVTAVEAFDIRFVELLLAHGANPNVPASRGTLLHYVVEKQKAELVRLLVAKGAEVDAIDDDGRTPLQKMYHYLSIAKHDETAAILVEAGAQLDEIPDIFDQTIAAQMSKTSIALIKRLKLPLDATLAKAADKSVIAAVEYLLERGANPVGEGCALGRAVSQQNEVIVIRFLALPQLDMRTTCFREAFDTAKRGKSDAVFDAFTETTFDVSAFFEELLMSGYDDARTARFLKSNTIDIRTRLPFKEHDSDTVEYIHIAGYKGNIRTIKALLERGADINAVSEKLRTPLQYLLQTNFGKALSLERVRELLALGADVNKASEPNRAPLLLAVARAHWHAVDAELEEIIIELVNAGTKKEIIKLALEQVQTVGKYSSRLVKFLEEKSR